MSMGAYDRSKSKPREPHSEETKEKMRKAHQGKIVSEETREKKRKAAKKWHEEHPGVKAGEKNPNFGKDFSGEKGPNWKGGIEINGYHHTCNPKLISEVRDRDNQTCQLCDRVWHESEKRFDTHHIYGPEDRKQPCNPKKLITLCVKCHSEVEKNFEQYVTIFEEIVNQRKE